MNKCVFAGAESELLGHDLSCDFLSVNQVRIEVIKSTPVSHNTKSLRSFLGLAYYFPHLIKFLAGISSVLYSVISKMLQFKWADKMQK